MACHPRVRGQDRSHTNMDTSALSAFVGKWEGMDHVELTSVRPGEREKARACPSSSSSLRRSLPDPLGCASLPCLYLLISLPRSPAVWPARLLAVHR